MPALNPQEIPLADIECAEDVMGGNEEFDPVYYQEMLAALKRPAQDDDFARRIPHKRTAIDPNVPPYVPNPSPAVADSIRPQPVPKVNPNRPNSLHPGSQTPITPTRLDKGPARMPRERVPIPAAPYGSRPVASDQPKASPNHLLTHSVATKLAEADALADEKGKSNGTTSRGSGAQIGTK
eukprot:gene1802-2135_t